MLAVEPGPIAPCCVRQTVAPVVAPTPLKRTAKGKAVLCPTMHPWARKVTRIASPTPEVAETVDLTPPIAGPSREGFPALFEGPIESGDEGVRGTPGATSGKSWCWLLVWVVTDRGPVAFGTPVLLKCKADAIATDAPTLPPPAPKRARRNRDHDMLSRMQALLRTGARQMDTLCVAQMAAQEALGVMAAAMLWEQGAMKEVSAWESEVEGTMREMARWVDEEGSD